MSGHHFNLLATDPLGRAYARTALPMIFVMCANGALAVVDALFLGWFVGPKALAAVTAVFPASMALVALGALVGSGMSSLLARDLGGGNIEQARRVVAGAQGLALTLCLVLMLAYALVGKPLVQAATGGHEDMAAMALTFLRIAILTSPLAFLSMLQGDVLRNEGRAGLMALLSLFLTLANIAFNYLFIAVLDLGVAGSAFGTALAQGLGLAIVLAWRQFGQTPLPLMPVLRLPPVHGWRPILALGAPRSLSFLGVAVNSAAVVAMIQILAGPAMESTLSAYGIVTRILTFAFLPILGLAQSMQTITGASYGAGDLPRTRASLKLAMVLALVYGIAVQAICTLFAGPIGAGFTPDPKVIAEVRHILPVVMGLYCLSGAQLMVATWFQALGDARRAALLALARPYLFSLPMIFLLPLVFGETGIWLATPVSEAMLLVLLTVVLLRLSSRGGLPGAPVLRV